MPLPPALTPEQRQAALDKAAAARRERAELKEKLKMGSVNLRELLNLADRHEVVARSARGERSTRLPYEPDTRRRGHLAALPSGHAQC